MRNLQTDLEICEKATSGPVRWHKLGSIYHLIGQYGPRPIILSTVTAKQENHWYPEMCISNLVDGLLEPLKPDHPDSVFIQESWEGWPESINRAIAAEASTKCLSMEYEFLAKEITIQRNKFTEQKKELQAEVERLRKALRIISDIRYDNLNYDPEDAECMHEIAVSALEFKNGD